MSKYILVKTEDDSSTLYSEDYKEHYHSTFGALNESQHIFIDAGLNQMKNGLISVFEMGFGTGLNALLSLKFAHENDKVIDYIAVEKHVLESEIYTGIDFLENDNETFLTIHKADWEFKNKINSKFYLTKYQSDILTFEHKQNYDLIYYDAFSPDIQPELWTAEIFRDLFNHLNSGGLLLTYTVKGDVKRALKSVGFQLEKLPGPKGKREILRARKV